MKSSKYWPHWRVSDVYKDGDSVGTARLEKITATKLMALQARFSHLPATINEGDVAMRLIVKDTLWMSDSYDEFMDHWDAIISARGRVLVNGLGMGCYLRCILSKPEVVHVDVVEKNADVIALISPYFNQPEYTGRVSIYHGDAFTFNWPKNTRWDFAWHDIWPTICSDDLKEHAKLNRRFGRRTDNQACWKHHTLLRLRRQGGFY